MRSLAHIATRSMPTPSCLPASIASLSLVPTPSLAATSSGSSIPRGLQIEESAEPAQLGIGAGPGGRAGERADRFYQRIAGVDRHAGVGIGQRLLGHGCGRLATSRLDFHAVVAKSARQWLAAPGSFLHSCCSSASPAGRGRLRADGKRRPRDPAARQLRNARNHRHSRRCRRQGRASRARYAGWRMAQRQGFKALWAKTHKRPVAEAPNAARFDARRACQLDHRRARADRPEPLHRRSRHPVRPRPRRANCSASAAMSAVRCRCS